MRTLPVKPEHQAELRYLIGEIDHLEKMKAPQSEFAAAMRRMAKRHLELYPELRGARVSFQEEETTKELQQVVYDNRDEWLQAMKAMVEETKKAPYVAFAADPNIKTFDVMGPKLEPGT